ncbi:uncharacterized protein LOC142350687 isoform X2 [Convolutriloba macropyga]|uniref:uncharacterized protein LOC142350687 isoform X2 n=1 Tax=Convolutriloba macropyga TaxID=536237 RepID=UPI003F524CD9
MPRRRPSAQGGRLSNRRRSVKPREGFIPNVYFNETFIECYTDLTDKRSKPKGEQVNFMESFKNANIESVPPLASASLDASGRGKISFANVKQETVTIFVSKAKEEAKDIFIYGRKDLINSKQCKEGFLSFLKAEHCDELLMLVDKIDETTRLKKTSEIEMANRDIFENFIREGAPMEVNLEPKLQNKLELDYKDPEMRKSKVLFLPAKKELFRHLDFEFSRFKTSSDYADLEMMEREKDVEKWKNNFNDVINDQIGRRVLLHFMMLERNEENLLFVMAVQKMKSCHLAEEVKEHNQMIFDHFVGHDEDGAIPESVPSTAGGIMQINIDWNVRAEIVQNLKGSY